MSADAKSGHDAGVIVAWVAATYGITIPLPVAEVAARELDAAARTLAGAVSRGSPNEEKPAFLGVLEDEAEGEA